MSKDKLPGDALALSLQKVWEVIRDQKDLNLPAHKVQRFNSTASCPIVDCNLQDNADVHQQIGSCTAAPFML